MDGHMMLVCCHSEIVMYCWSLETYVKQRLPFPLWLTQLSATTGEHTSTYLCVLLTVFQQVTTVMTVTISLCPSRMRHPTARLHYMKASTPFSRSFAGCIYCYIITWHAKLSSAVCCYQSCLFAMGRRVLCVCGFVGLLPR